MNIRWILPSLLLCAVVAFSACGTAEPLNPTQPAQPAGAAVATAEQTTTQTTAQTTEATAAEPEATAEPEKVDPLQLFNSATKKVIDQKAGYTKTRYSKITKLEFGVLEKIQLVRDAVAGFFGVDGKTMDGAYNGKATKGAASKLMKISTLTNADLKSANAEPDGKGGYVVTLQLKDGSTRWSGQGGEDPGSGTKKGPVDRGPLCYGEDNSDIYDHKTALNLYRSINGADNAATKDIGETTYNARLTARIDSEGRMQKMEGRMDMTVNVYHVKYLLVTLTDKAGSGYGTVTYDHFVY